MTMSRSVRAGRAPLAFRLSTYVTMSSSDPFIFQFPSTKNLRSEEVADEEEEKDAAASLVAFTAVSDRVRDETTRLAARLSMVSRRCSELFRFSLSLYIYIYLSIYLSLSACFRCKQRRWRVDYNTVVDRISFTYRTITVLYSKVRTHSLFFLFLYCTHASASSWRLLPLQLASSNDEEKSSLTSTVQ